MALEREARALLSAGPDASLSLSGRKILITGASGFLGSHLCRRLGETGAELHAVSRSPRAAQINVPRWWQGDMTDIATVRHLLHEINPDIIFHMSGVATALPGLELVLPTFHSLLTSTVNILTVATEISCRRVVLPASQTEPAPESIDATPDSPYAAAKLAGTMYGQMFHKLYGTPVVIARIFQTYGPGQETRKLIPYVTLSLLRGKAPELSNGQWQVDWIYVEDVMNGLLAIAQEPNVEGCIIDLGSGALATVREIVQHLLHLTGAKLTPLYGVRPDRPFERPRVADTTYAYAKLGWRPRFSLEEGLRRTIDWYGRRMQGDVQ